MSTAVASAEPPAGERPRSHSYAQILRSAALIGGSSVITVMVSIVRVKVMALLLGPAGVGLLGVFSSLQELAQSVAGLGVNSSGVRQVAEAAATGEERRIARTAAVLRRTSVVLGVTGAAILVGFRAQLSEWTFQSPRFAGPIALLSLAVVLRVASDGQGAVIQGMRRIGDVARIAVFAAVAGTLAGLGFVYVLREDGVVPMLICIAAASLLFSWHYRRKIALPPVSLTRSEVRREAGALLTLGFAFMASAVLTTAAAYAIRALVTRSEGLEAAGLYQAAWSLGGLYVGFILQAMGIDFYPRLTAVAHDHRECNRLVNEQTHVGLLLGGPGIIATLTFAPVVVSLFYSGSFGGAVVPLRWVCLGMALRIVAWPMGYIILAKNARALFLATEVSATLVHLALASFLIPLYGAAGASMAFFGLYVWHAHVVYFIVRRLTRFCWSAENRQTGLVLTALVGVVLLTFLSPWDWLAFLMRLVAVVASAALFWWRLIKIAPLTLPPPLVDVFTSWKGRSTAP